MDNIKIDLELKRNQEENQDEENLSYYDKVKNFYERNKKELGIVFGLLLIINLINPTYKIYKQYGGAQQIEKELGKSLLAKIKNNNIFVKMLGWGFSFVKSLLTFGALILVLAILPGLPIFIFMGILFFILRARMANIKSI
jgi:hypothetical protein